MHSMCIIMSIQNNTHDAHASQEELNMKKYLALLLAAIMALSLEIGRASCRERV